MCNIELCELNRRCRCGYSGSSMCRRDKSMARLIRGAIWSNTSDGPFRPTSLKRVGIVNSLSNSYKMIRTKHHRYLIHFILLTLLTIFLFLSPTSVVSVDSVAKIDLKTPSSDGVFLRNYFFFARAWRMALRSCLFGRCSRLSSTLFRSR